MVVTNQENSAETQEEKPLISEELPEQEKKLFLGLFPSHGKNLCLVTLLDISVTTAVCRDVFFSSCLTLVTPRLLCFLALRLLFIASTAYGAYVDNTSYTFTSLFLFFLQTLGTLVYFASVVFSNDWGNFDVRVACISCACIVAMELYILTMFEVAFESKKSRLEWREDMKRRGKTTALEKDLEREAEEKEAQYLNLMKKLVVYFYPRSRLLALTAFGVVGCKICSSLKPLVYASILDGLMSKDWDIIKTKFYQYLALIIAENIFHYIQAYYQRVSREYVEMDMRLVAFKKVLSMECGYFDPLSTGELMSTCYHHVYEITDRLGWQLRSILEFSIQSIMTVFIVFSLDTRLAICACMVAPLMAAGVQYFNQHCHRISKINRDNWSSLEKTITEAISNIRTVKVFGCEEHEHNIFSEIVHETYATVMKDVWYCETRWTFCNFIPSLSKFMLMYYGICLVLEDEISFGEMTAFFVYQGHINWIFHKIADMTRTLSRMLVQSHKVFKLIDRDCKLPRNLPGVSPETCEGKVELKDVTFAYPSKLDTNVIHNISLTVNPGEIVALVGHSGCGKTTIVKLISYLYGPQKGSVTLDGIPVADYTPKSFSDKVVCVPQEPVLFARSLHDNISYGRTLSREEVIEAAKLANAHEFIIKLAQGYDSVVGERGITLSGGQRQRICIARALARKPNVLLLDEATASLDSKSEHLVHRAIDNIILGGERQMSLVIVAHRLSTVKNADRIFVIEEGRIVEEGSHSKLMKACGPYASFVQQQLLAEEETEENEKENGIIFEPPDNLVAPTITPQVSA